VAPATIVLVSSKVTPLSSSLSQQKQPIAKPVEGHHQQQRQIVAAVTRARPVAGGRCNTVIARPGNHWRGGWWHSNINSRGRHGGGVRNHRRDIGICRRRDIGIGRRRLFIHDGSRGHNDFGDRRRNLSGCDYGSLRWSDDGSDWAFRRFRRWNGRLCRRNASFHRSRSRRSFPRGRNGHWGCGAVR
jgi:hypothetical protein